jgi:Ca2+-binding EF-hand superfamily protein
MKRVLLITAIAICLGAAARAFADDPQIDPDQLFKKLDVNGDGKLTASEIPQQHRKFFDRLVRIGDTDKNGELTREEFDRALKQTDEPVTNINNVGNLGAGPPMKGKVDPKRIFEMLDKNKDGKLTREEASKRPRVLALFDRLGKDELTLEDLSALNKGGQGKKKRPTAVAAETSANNSSEEMSEGKDGRPVPAFFQLLDTNHDGRLSQEELSKAAALFDKLDRNHDGFLDPKELMAAAPKGDGEEMAAPSGRPAARPNFRNGQRLYQMIMRADTNGDGKISEEEAPPQLKKHFAKLDTNGDGFLDKSEIETWIKHRQKRLGGTPGTENPTTQNSGF